MAKRNKNMGCLGSFIYISLLLIALGALVTASFYGIIIVGVIFLIIYFFKFITFLIKKIYLYVSQKYNERVHSGKPTFIRKFLNILNMNNLGKKIQTENAKTDEMPCDISTIVETAAVTDGIGNNWNIQELALEKAVEKEISKESTKYISSTDNHKTEITENIHSVTERVVEEAKLTPNIRKMKRQHVYMSEYDIEQFAKECNAYVVRKERNKDKSEGFYHDRFYEEYIPTFRKTIAFTGNNFSEPAVEICAALIISGSVKRGEKIKPNDYYSYFENLYGIVNIHKLHVWLYENDYLRKATPKEALNLYKVPELKTILDSMGLKKNGNKEDLINRIVENIDNETKEKLSNECDRYFRSEKGEMFLSENQDYVLFHRKQYGITFQEFCEHRILQGRKRNFYDTIFQALNEKAFSYQKKGYISQLEMIYYCLSNSLYDEGKYELSLQYALYRLYFSTNLSSKHYLFSVENIRFDGVKTAKSRILSEETFNPHTIARILELQPYFREQMIDAVYTPEILPYCLFGKYDMLDVVHDLYEGTFDAEQYTNYIRINYGNYIKKYL